MKRYLLFMYDFISDYDTVDDAMFGYKQNKDNVVFSDDLRFHIYEVNESKIVLKHNDING